VRTSKIGVDFYSSQWRTDVDTVPGDKPGEAKITDGRTIQGAGGKTRQMYVTFPGMALPGPDRHAELFVYGTGDRPRGISAQALPHGPGGSYTIFFPASESVRRLVLRSRSIEHIRFDDVQLWPK
jgi:hypothetical protein